MNMLSLVRRAKTQIEKHKDTMKTLIGSVEGFGAATVVGIVEGRMTQSARVDLMPGVPLTLGLGLVTAGAGAARLLDDYSVHAANMGTGLLGAYGHQLGREIGAGMRIRSGQNIGKGILPSTRVAEIQQKLLAANPQAKPGVEVGWVDSFTGEYAVGAAPAPLTPAQLEQMVREAASAQ